MVCTCLVILFRFWVLLVVIEFTIWVVWLVLGNLVILVCLIVFGFGFLVDVLNFCLLGIKIGFSVCWFSIFDVIVLICCFVG